MQPNDQDELRRQAQRVLTRRISVDPDRQEAPARPRQLQPVPRRQNNRQRQPSRDAEQLRELQERRARDQQRAQAVVEAEVRESDIHRDIHRDVHRDVHSRTHEGVHQSRHQDVHAGAYALASANRRRNQIYRDLFDPEARKRAIVLAEILGKPVALREHEGNATSGSY